MHWQLEGKHALVTGGTSGIGFAIADELTRQGCVVTVTGLTNSEVRQAAAQNSSLIGRVLDVGDAEGIHRLVEPLEQLDLLINCAGMIARDGQEYDMTVFQKVVDVNLTGTMRLCDACYPRLAGSQGCVVNLASMLTFFGSGAAPAYSASKGGIAQLTKSLAIAWAAEGIRVNAIAPGWIETPLTAPLQNDPQRSQAILQRTPLGRWGQPQDVVGAALFLCSPAAAFITGVVLPIDGGYSAC